MWILWYGFEHWLCVLVFEGLPVILACKVVREVLNCFASWRMLNFWLLRLAFIAKITRDSILRSDMIVVGVIAC
jgi:hypothetical protein